MVENDLVVKRSVSQQRSRSSSLCKMNSFCLRRLLSPSLVETVAISCSTFSNSGIRWLRISSSCQSDVNKDYKINPLFENRNPRTLEFMGLIPKRKGWKFQSPRKDYYHKLEFIPTSQGTHAYVEHWTGKRVIEASTKEAAVFKHLYSVSDVSASWNIGRLLGRRMLEAGITHVFYEEAGDHIESEKKQYFLQALKDCHVELREPDVIEHEHVPGINYDGYNRLHEKKKISKDYQKL